jgi:hypothetical protein
MSLPTLQTERKIKYENTTMYKNNSGFSPKLRVSAFNKSNYLTEKLVCENPLLFLYKTVTINTA